MPDANVLQEFLVSLGWDVDQRGGTASVTS